MRTKTKPPPIRDMIRHDEDAEQVYADNELIPLSYSGIADPQEKVDFMQLSHKTRNPKAAFIERFQNPYYHLCREKLAGVDKKKEMFLQEKVR